MNGLLLAQNAGDAGGFFVGFGIFWILMFILGIAALGVWIWALVDAIQNPALDSTMRIVWVLVIVFTQIIVHRGPPRVVDEDLGSVPDRERILAEVAGGALDDTLHVYGPEQPPLKSLVWFRSQTCLRARSCRNNSAARTNGLKSS